MESVNWLHVFILFIPLWISLGMIVMLIRDHRKAKKRDKRCHAVIRNWWELRAE